MKKKIFSLLADELREVYPELDSVSEYKLIQALESLKDVQNLSLPNAQFKSKLKEKLQTLAELDSRGTQKYQKTSFFSRLSVFGGVFASILFVGAFFYTLQDTLFQKYAPVSKVSETQISEAEILDTMLWDKTPSQIFPVSENIEKTNTVPTNILTEKDVLVSHLAKPVQKIIPKESKDNIPVSQNTKTQSDETSTKVPPEVIPNQENMFDGDNSAFERGNMRLMKTDVPTTWDETDIKTQIPVNQSQDSTNLDENDSISSPERMMWDMMMSTKTIQTPYTFENFCADSGGILSGKPKHQLCKKDKKTCSETEYYNGTCYLEEYNENDTEIFLEELINEIQK
jgi:hypothetical protein